MVVKFFQIVKLRYEESYVKLRVKQHVIFTVYDYILHLT